MAQNEAPSLSSRLTRATSRRRELAEAMAHLEEIASSPVSAEDWLDRVEVGLADLRIALDAHIEEVEAPDGLLAEIVAMAPRLSSSTDELREEHMDLLGSWLRTEAAVRAAREDRSKLATVRRKVVTLIGRLTMHRQAGSDLVYESYHVDIGGFG